MTLVSDSSRMSPQKRHSQRNGQSQRMVAGVAVLLLVGGCAGGGPTGDPTGPAPGVGAG